MFFHFPKPSPQEMALSFSNSKDIIKDHYTNLTLHPLVENPSTFSSSGISSEKITALFFKKLKLNLEQDKTNDLTNNLTEQKDTSNKDRSEHGANKISKEQQQQQQQQQQQSKTSQSSSKEKPSNDAVNEMSINNLKKKVFIIGDSMIEKVDGYLLTDSIKHEYLVKVRPFLAVKAVDMFDYVNLIQRNFGPDAYILYVGTNDLTTEKKTDEICSEISRLVKVLKTNKN